jgi:excisionase family DNA binding protein
MSTQATANVLLDVHGIAEYACVSERMARHILDRRLVPVVKIGRLVRVRRSDLDAYIEARTIPANVA